MIVDSQLRKRYYFGRLRKQNIDKHICDMAASRRPQTSCCCQGVGCEGKDKQVLQGDHKLDKICDEQSLLLLKNQLD